jgi:hypothetical protein
MEQHVIRNCDKRTVQDEVIKNRKRPPRSQRIHRRRMLALQRREGKAQMVTARG